MNAAIRLQWFEQYIMIVVYTLLLMNIYTRECFTCSISRSKWHITDCCCYKLPWWRHQMETFSAILAICAGNSPVTGEFPPQRPATRSSDVFFDLRLNKRLSKQSGGWWFETPSSPLWRHRNAVTQNHNKSSIAHQMKYGDEKNCIQLYQEPIAGDLLVSYSSPNHSIHQYGFVSINNLQSYTQGIYCQIQMFQVFHSIYC